MNDVFTQKDIAERLDKVDGHQGLAVGVLYNQLRNMLAKGLLPHLQSDRSGPSLKSRFAVEYDRVGLARARILTKLTTIGFDTALLKSVQDKIPDDELDFVLGEVTILLLADFGFPLSVLVFVFALGALFIVAILGKH